MAQSLVNKNQDISYTNLDFSSMYEEALNLIKQLTYKWDPSISDESDPGVVLLKLNTLLADKCNYNIDKSALEAFPLSVTQEGNARQLYEQLGYYMNWYESALATINIKWVGDIITPTQTYTIPRFSIITDNTSTHNYAIIGTMDEDKLIVSDGKLTTDGNTISLIAMEGTPTQYTYLGQQVITSEMVDENNRLFFETKYVSQNGIFIRNSGSDQMNYAEWKRVDNLYEQPFNDLRYKFGHDAKSDLCYIEFPDNYASLIGNGIEIIYMVVEPEFTNIPARVLDRFLVELRPEENPDIVLNSDSTAGANISLFNIGAAYGHKDVESIDEAYENYKKVVGTFHTLITLRDYVNYISNQENEFCSNAIITDRTNDPQSTYTIMGKTKGLDAKEIQVEKEVSDNNYVSVDTSQERFDEYTTYYVLNEDDETHELIFEPTTDKEFEDNKLYFKKEEKDSLSPFSLKLYLLQNALGVTEKDAFENTFELMSETPSLDTLMGDTAHIEHTYEDILPYGKNEYIKTNDTTVQENKSYYEYNAYKGSYDLVTSGVYVPTEDDADPLSEDNKDGWKYYREGKLYYVKNMITNTYTQYTKPKAEQRSPKYVGLFELLSLQDSTGGNALNPKDRGLYEIAGEYLLPHICIYKAKYPLEMSITTFDGVTSSIRASIVDNMIRALYYNLSSNNLQFGEEISLDYLTEIIVNSDSRIKGVNFNAISYTISAVYWSDTKNSFVEIILPSSAEHIKPDNYADVNNVEGYQIAKDIIAKSILAGTTQLLVPFDKFNYHLNQEYVSYVDNITKLNAETVINLGATRLVYDELDNISHNYTLKQNEVITLYEPSFEEIRNFSTGVHFEYKLNNTIEANEIYQLVSGEYFVVYSSDTDDNGNVIGYNIHAIKAGGIIQPSFELEEQSSFANLSDFFTSVLHNKILESELVVDTEYTSAINWMNVIKNDVLISSQVIDGSNSVKLLQLNQTIYTQDSNKLYYWVLNNVTTTDSNNLKSYVLFDSFDVDTQKDQSNEINTYTLKTGEYLYVMDKITSEWTVYGLGTTITRVCGYNSDYTDVSYTIDGDYDWIEYMPLSEIPAGANFEWITTTTGNDTINPHENGLYEIDYEITYEEVPGENEGDPSTIVQIQTPNGYKRTQDLYDKRDLDYHEVKTNSFPSIEEAQSLYILPSEQPDPDNEEDVDDMNAGKYVYVDYIDEEGTVVFDRLSDYSSLETFPVDTYTYYIAPKPIDYSWYIEDNEGEYIEVTGNGYIDLSEVYYTKAPENFDYYVMVMKSLKGNYTSYTDTYITDGVQSEQVFYVPAPDKTTTVFEPVDNSELMEPVNPVEKGYYEEVKYNSVTLQDTYTMDGNTYYDTYSRYTLSEDETNITRNVFEDRLELSTIDITSPETFINIDSTTYGQSISPTGQNLLTVDTSDTSSYTLKTYYTRTQNPYHNTRYDYHVVGNVSLDNIPVLEGWYEYDPVNKVGWATKDFYPYTATNFVYEKSVNPFVKIPSDSPYLSYPKGDNNPPARDLDLSDYGLFYKRYESEPIYHCTYVTSDNDVTETHVYRKCSEEMLACLDTTGKKVFSLIDPYKKESEVATYFETYWDKTVSESTPKDWLLQDFDTDTGWKIVNGSVPTGVGLPTDKTIYIFVPYRFISVPSEIKPTVWDTNIIYPKTEGETDNDVGVFIPIGEGIDLSSFNGFKLYVMVDTLSKVTSGKGVRRLYNIMRALYKDHNFIDIMNLVSVQYIPIYYIFKDLYKFKSKTYYEPYAIFDKKFSPVEAWTCPAVSSEQIAIDPEAVLQRLWIENCQDNCAIFIKQNTLHSLAEGDLISVTSNISNTEVNWPVFSNEELILDLDNYSVYYQKSNDEITELAKYTVPQCDWRGFSTLLINTGSISGQKLEPNHSITFYNGDEKLDTVSGQSKKNTYLQLEYPINNVVGKNIDITSVDDLGNELNNSAYVYNQLNSTETYKYVLSTGETYLYFNNPNLQYPEIGNRCKIQVPIDLPEGEYLIPITGIDDIPLTATYTCLQKYKEEQQGVELPILVEPVEGETYSDNYTGDNIKPEKLKNYINGDEVFVGDKYRFIYFNAKNTDNIEINHPELVTILAQKSPKDLGWLNADGEVSDIESYGFSDLTEQVDLSKSETESSEEYIERMKLVNPKKEKWYQIEDDGGLTTYTLSEDTWVEVNDGEPIHQYYKPKILYANKNSNTLDNLIEFEITLPISLEDSTTEVVFVVDDIFKYKPNPLFIDAFDEISTQVKRLDKTEYYNYKYIPKNDDLIENPLRPENFWNQNHVCNPYTIAQLDTSDTSNIYYKFITR